MTTQCQRYLELTVSSEGVIHPSVGDCSYCGSIRPLIAVMDTIRYEAGRWTARCPNCSRERQEISVLNFFDDNAWSVDLSKLRQSLLDEFRRRQKPIPFPDRTGTDTYRRSRRLRNPGRNGDPPASPHNYYEHGSAIFSQPFHDEMSGRTYSAGCQTCGCERCRLSRDRIAQRMWEEEGLR